MPQAPANGESEGPAKTSRASEDPALHLSTFPTREQNVGTTPGSGVEKVEVPTRSDEKERE